MSGRGLAGMSGPGRGSGVASTRPLARTIASCVLRPGQGASHVGHDIARGKHGASFWWAAY